MPDAADGFQGPQAHAEYECREFCGLDLSGEDLTGCSLIDCAFKKCNLANAVLTDARLQRVYFEGCKLAGVDFSLCNPFLLGFSFKDCLLRSCLFSGLALKGVSFAGCEIRECDFIGTKLTGANFAGCTLSGSVFRRCDLAGADFREACEYEINPTINALKKARFSLPGAIGLLHGMDIIIE